MATWLNCNAAVQKGPPFVLKRDQGIWKGASTYAQWYRLYEIPTLERGKPWHFKYLTVNHIYYPLAQSSGKIYELLKANKARGGDRAKKLFQFLNEIGARALGRHIGRVQEMAESSPDKESYERRVRERFGEQREFEFVFPEKEAAN